jgi:hypothetical protein
VGVSPSKICPVPPIERQEYKPFQKHVPSYYVKISKRYYVWAEPTVLRGGPYLKIEEQPFSTLTRGADSNPARVIAQEEVHMTENICFQIFKYNGVALSIES